MRLLYLDLDTLRADHLGCYGYRRNTSPVIDGIAREGVRFDNYFCSDAPCLPSRNAMMTGMFGIHSGCVGHIGTAADTRKEGATRGFIDQLAGNNGQGLSLPRLFRHSGYNPVYVGGFGERHSAYQYYSGFREVYDTGMHGMESAEHVTPTALDWIGRNARKDNWYLHINYWDPHTPYRVPEDFGNPFADEPLPSWITDDVLAGHWQMAGPHTAQDINMFDNRTDPRFPRQPGHLPDRKALRALFDGYDCGIRYMDGHIGRILEALKTEGVLDDLVIIVSSDHGENMGELGIYAEHATADIPTCRIPMIIRWPGKTSPGVDSGLHYNLDLLPTLADILGVAPKPLWGGRSFRPVLETGGDCGRDQLVLSQMAHVCQRSVRWDRWLYVRTYHGGYHLFPKEMLFDVVEDPHEQENLAERRPDLCREAAWRLAEWHDGMMMSMPFGYSEDPLWQIIREGGPSHARGKLEEYLKRLEASGRKERVGEMTSVYASEINGLRNSRY
jgi:arylsulfatase A-like enzyme